MRDATSNYGDWSSEVSYRGYYRAASRPANESRSLSLLLAIAGVLLVSALALDDKVVDWVLAPSAQQVSAIEADHLENVRYLLVLDQARRGTGTAGR